MKTGCHDYRKKERKDSVAFSFMLSANSELGCRAADAWITIPDYSVVSWVGLAQGPQPLLSKGVSHDTSAPDTEQGTRGEGRGWFASVAEDFGG